MKANEMPERIYFRECDKSILDIYSTKESDNEIEYTRTDAFIEKLDCWLYEKGREYCGEFDEGFLIEFNNSEEVIEDFRKYMEE